MATAEMTETDGGTEAKTSVQQVHEYCARAGLEAVYEWDTHGDLCNPSFGCRVTVGDITGAGEGPSKKAAKQKAAEAAWEVIGPRAAALDTEPRGATSEPPPNPVGALQELCTNKGWRLPQYTQLEERGQPHEREYAMSCRVEAVEGLGTGPTKKAAKREAALKVLAELRAGLMDGSTDPAEPATAHRSNALCTGASLDPASQGPL